MSNRQPRFRSDLIARPVRRRGGRYIEILDPQTGEKMRFSSLGYSIAYLMNGERDLEALASRIQDELGIDIPVVKLAKLVERLERLGCLEGPGHRGRQTVPMPPAAIEEAVRRQTPSDVLATCEYRRVRNGSQQVDVRSMSIDELVTHLHAAQSLERSPARRRTPAPLPGTPAPIRNRPLPVHVAAREGRKPREESDPHNAVVVVPTLHSTHESLLSYGGSTSVVFSPRAGKGRRDSDSPPVTGSILWLAFVLLGLSCVWASWSILQHL